MSINITKKCSTNNTSSAPGRSIDYIVIHYTAGTNSKKNNAIYAAEWFANPSAQASADFIVDDELIIQMNGDIKNRYCWAVGGVENAHNSKAGAKYYQICTNRNSISIEICSNNKTGKMTYGNDPNYYFTDAELSNAIELTKYLMKTYGIDADHVIRHYDVNGKLCPGIIGWNAESGSEEKWKWFKAQIGGASAPEVPTVYYRVRKTWSDAASQLGAYTILDNAKDNCPAGYSVFDPDGKVLYTVASKGFQATELNGLTESEKIKKIAPLYQEVMKKTGMLASVGLAQFCLESGYGTTDLAQKANNLHGMKCSLSGNKWEGSTWDGTSKYTKRTAEQLANGTEYYVDADFRKYTCCEDSIADRAAYLIGAMNGNVKRYPGINHIKSWKEQAELIKAGGYATDVNYVSKLESLITRYNLFQYDDVEVNSDIPASDILPETEQPWYRVRLKWSDAASQIGAYHDLANAKECVDNNPGYTVFDEKGNALYAVANKIPYLVQVTSNKVKIYTGPGIGYATTGATTGIGKFTIVEEKKGKVNSKGTTGTWGRLKSGAGWIRVGTSTVKKVK